MKNSSASKSNNYLESVRSEVEQFMLELPPNVQTQSMRRVKTDYDLYLLHGQLSCQRDLPEKSVRSFEECLRLRPGSFSACLALGLIHRGRGKFERAAEYFDMALAIEPRDFKTRLFLLSLKLQLGEPDGVTIPLEHELLSPVRPICNNSGIDYEHLTRVASLTNPHPDWGIAFTDEAMEHFERHKFATLRQVMSQPLLKLVLEQYLGYLKQGMMLFQKDKQRHVRNDDPLSSLIQHHLCTHVQKLVGCELVPTYTIGLHYLEGGNIKPHIDRYQNEISMSICIGADPEPVTWPLFALKDTEEVHDILQPNDAFLYRGNEIVHYRKPLPAGQTVTQLIIGFRSIDEKHCNCQ